MRLSVVYFRRSNLSGWKAARRKPSSRWSDSRRTKSPAAGIFWSLLFVVLGIFSSTLGAQEGYERMEQFLTRLGLFDLRIAHLEQTLEADIDSERQQELARKLADLYAERLMASSAEKARYDDTMERIEALLQEYPQANTTALQVMLLQADYQRAESLMASWMNQPRDSAPREEARQILERIAPRLLVQQKKLNQQVEALTAKIDQLPEGDRLAAEEKRLRRLQVVAARATFFAAWSNYYLGLASGADSAGQPYVLARDIFLGLLGFDKQLPEDLEPEWLGLESIWRARAMIGLGLSLAACGDIAGCTRCFQLLEHPGVAAEVKDQAPSWYVRALLNAGQWDRARAYAEEQIGSYEPPPTQGKVSLCVTLVREGFGAAAADGDQRHRQLGHLGLVGLARLGQLGAISTLIEKYEIEADSDAGFVLLWAAGQEQFAAAEKTRSAAGYETAAKTLRKALQSPETKKLAGPAARCRYTLAWCYFRLNQFAEAGREFSDAFPGLCESQDELAVESAWMAFLAYRKQAETESRFVSRVSDARRRLERNFPDHPYVQRAGYEMTKLLEKSDPATMIEQLQAVAPSDPNYPLARYDLCLALQRLWKRHQDDKRRASEYVEALREAVETYLETVNTDPDAAKRLTLCLLAAKAALHNIEPALDIAAAMLTRADRFASQLPDSHPEVSEYHYRLLELAAAKGEDDRRQQQARWLAEHAEGTPYEEAALVIVANALDSQIRNAGSNELETLNSQAYSVYQRLVELLGANQRVLAKAKNARISVSRLAHYALQTERPAEAAGLLERLLEVRPRDRRYLQRAAEAHIQADQYAEALPHVRTLLAGLPAGSDQWYAAKYRQLVALARTDEAQARKVYRQFKLLYPDLGGNVWEEKFTDLARNW